MIYGWGVNQLLADSLLTLLAAWLLVRLAGRSGITWGVAAIALAATAATSLVVHWPLQWLGHAPVRARAPEHGCGTDLVIPGLVVSGPDPPGHLADAASAAGCLAWRDTRLCSIGDALVVAARCTADRPRRGQRAGRADAQDAQDDDGDAITDAGFDEEALDDAFELRSRTTHVRSATPACRGHRPICTPASPARQICSSSHLRAMAAKLSSTMKWSLPGSYLPVGSTPRATSSSSTTILPASRDDHWRP